MKFVWGTGLLHPNPSPALTPFMTLVSRKTSVPSDGPLATLGSCYLSELACWPYSVSCSYCRSQPWGQAHRPAAELDRSIKGFAVSKFMFITLALRQRVLFENDGRRKKPPISTLPSAPQKSGGLRITCLLMENSIRIASPCRPGMLFGGRKGQVG